MANDIRDCTFAGGQLVTNATLGAGLCFIAGQLHREWVIDTTTGRLSEWRPVPSFATIEEATRLGAPNHGR